MLEMQLVDCLPSEHRFDPQNGIVWAQCPVLCSCAQGVEEGTPEDSGSFSAIQ